ncbi:hypothetical protein [Enterobacter hormaechei]|uniref:hypothetical protein n=1 Tax=Enterobacter hormaechei TaxID=158836 RepID=UPI002948EB50|nr:hypothetical protein [Enterobacter hormaechei]MDV5717566.1 hypothetical protein [Enterobacter hormaechei]
MAVFIVLSSNAMAKRWNVPSAFRQTKQKAKDYAQEAVFKDWQKAVKMSARQLKLHLFSDDSIDLQLPFAQ